MHPDVDMRNKIFHLFTRQIQGRCKGSRCSHTPVVGLAVTAVMLILIGCGGGGGGGGVGGIGGAVENPDWAPTTTYLPTLTINTANAQDITSKEDYVDGEYKMADSNGVILQEGGLEIRGRGNSTWKMPKKPYHIKLTDKAALMGMPGGRHWVLLANCADITLLRNETAFELSRLLGMEYTTRSVFVELYLNGNYRGVYQLTEHIRIAKDRVNIPELKETDISADTITGGYLIEVDERRGEDFCFDSERTDMVFCVKNPETLLEPGRELQRQYIVNYISRTDEAIFGEQFKDETTGYAAYIDVDSAIHYYLINELLKNIDGNLRLSAYMYKKRDGKLTFGPVWDFDLALGNASGATSPEGWQIRSAPWFERMFEDPAFEQKVKARWGQMKTEGILTALFQHIDDQSLYLINAQENNFQKWIKDNSYEKDIDDLKEWLTLRIAWMDAQLSE